MKTQNQIAAPEMKLLLTVADGEMPNGEPNQILKARERFFLGHSRRGQGMRPCKAEDRRNNTVDVFGVTEVSLQDALLWSALANGRNGSGHLTEVFNMAAHEQLAKCGPDAAELEWVFEYSNQQAREGVAFAGSHLVRVGTDGERHPVTLREAIRLWLIVEQDHERYQDGTHDPEARAKFLAMIEGALDGK